MDSNITHATSSAVRKVSPATSSLVETATIHPPKQKLAPVFKASKDQLPSRATPTLVVRKMMVQRGAIMGAIMVISKVPREISSGDSVSRPVMTWRI